MLIHRFEIKLAAFFDTRGPSRRDGFGSCVEFKRVGSVLVQIAKHGFFPTTKGVIGKGHWDWNVNTDHANIDPIGKIALIFYHRKVVF